MESRAFIKAAGLLMVKIKDIAVTSGISDLETEQRAREAVQKELNQLFGGLGNPTLPSAYKLRDVAVAAGYFVNPQVLNRLSQFENL